MAHSSLSMAPLVEKSPVWDRLAALDPFTVAVK